MIERSLVFGARDATAPDPNAAKSRFLGWQTLLAQAATSLPVTDAEAQAAVRRRLFDALPNNAYVTYQTDESYSPADGTVTPPHPPVGGVNDNRGLASAFAALGALPYVALNPKDAVQLAACADPDKWTAGKDVSRPDGRCEYTRKALEIDVSGVPAVGLTNLMLLSEGDDFFLAQPRVVENMFDGAFDTNPANVSPGGKINPNRPQYGEAFHGFTDFNVLIPVIVESETSPRWVPVATTLDAFAAETGLQVREIRRPAYWVDAQVIVLRKKGKDWIGETLDQSKFRDSQGRIRFHFDQEQATSSIGLLDKNARADFLLAPGDRLILSHHSTGQ